MHSIAVLAVCYVQCGVIVISNILGLLLDTGSLTAQTFRIFSFFFLDNEGSLPVRLTVMVYTWLPHY